MNKKAIQIVVKVLDINHEGMVYNFTVNWSERKNVEVHKFCISEKSWMWFKVWTANNNLNKMHSSKCKNMLRQWKMNKTAVVLQHIR